MKLAKGAHLITAATMLAICAGLIVAGYQLLYWDGYAPAAGFAPIWVGIAGVILSGLMLFGIGTQGYADESSMPNRSEAFRVGTTVLGLLVFVTIAPLLGMIPTALIFMIFMLLVVLRRSPVASIATAVGTTMLVYGIFVVWLKVPLPVGIFGI